MGELNERAISIEEVSEAVNGMKFCKVPAPRCGWISSGVCKEMCHDSFRIVFKT